MLLLAETVWIRAEIHALNAMMCCENLTEDAGRISLTHVFVHKAEKMQLRCNRNYSRSVVDLWADVMCTSEDMPGPAWHWCSLCATLIFQWGHAWWTAAVSLTLPGFIWRILNPRGHGNFFCVCVCLFFKLLCCNIALNAMSLYEHVKTFSQCYVLFYREFFENISRSKHRVEGKQLSYFNT